MNILVRYCETEQQYMAKLVDKKEIAKGLEDGRYQLRDDGLPIEYRPEDLPSKYDTKDMTPKTKQKKATAKKKD